MRLLAAHTRGNGRIVLVDRSPQPHAAALVIGRADALRKHGSVLAYVESEQEQRPTDANHHDPIPRIDTSGSGLDHVELRPWAALDPTVVFDEPIELLCVSDLPSVREHASMLGSLVMALEPGSVLCQLDFGRPERYWLPLVMWRLRSYCEPIEAFGSSPLAAFRFIDSPNATLLDAITETLVPTDTGTFSAHTWTEIRAYWSKRFVNAQDALLAHEAMHAAACGRFDAAIDAAQRWDAWSRSIDAVGRNPAEGWISACRPMLLRALERHGSVARRAAILLAEIESESVRPRPSRTLGQTPHRTIEQRVGAWSRVFDRLKSEGRTRIVLFGGGAHTSWLLQSGIVPASFEIVCVLDDNPAVASIEGVAVMVPDRAQEFVRHAMAIVPSSDTYEPEIRRRIAEVFPGRMEDIVSVYEVESSSRAGATVTQEVTGLRCVAGGEQIEDASPLRPLLGLPEARAWLDDFLVAYKFPDWVNGHVRYRDTLFLWDLIEAIRPQLVIEIGTASGISAASIALAMDRFRPMGNGQPKPKPELHTYDIAKRCYFDLDRAVGAAVAQVAPHLSDRVWIHRGSTASEAARMHRVGSAGLAFIDGDHRHPAPTLDCLTLLDTLAPGAWIALHDVELTAVYRALGAGKPNTATGAEQLFDRWPFEKIKPAHEPHEMNNIAAIRLPESRWDAAEVLLSLLAEPWETGELVPERLGNAVGRLNRLI